MGDVGRGGVAIPPTGTTGGRSGSSGSSGSSGKSGGKASTFGMRGGGGSDGSLSGTPSRYMTPLVIVLSAIGFVLLSEISGGMIGRGRGDSWASANASE